MELIKKTYSELITLPDFLDRYNYLKLDGVVGEETFGYERYINQQFYKSTEWKNLRNQVILRDGGCDLGIPGREIVGRVLIHHINPISPKDITFKREQILDMDNLICVSKRTHDAIHYGTKDLLFLDPVERTPNDTCPWRK